MTEPPIPTCATCGYPEVNHGTGDTQCQDFRPPAPLARPAYGDGGNCPDCGGPLTSGLAHVCP